VLVYYFVTFSKRLELLVRLRLSVMCSRDLKGKRGDSPAQFGSRCLDSEASIWERILFDARIHCDWMLSLIHLAHGGGRGSSYETSRSGNVPPPRSPTRKRTFTSTVTFGLPDPARFACLVDTAFSFLGAGLASWGAIRHHSRQR
jgi:hypothetical protein